MIQVLEMCNALSASEFRVILYLPDYCSTVEDIIETIKVKIGITSVPFEVKLYRPISVLNRLQFLSFLKILFFNKDAWFFLRNPYLFIKSGVFNRKIIYEAHSVLWNNEFNLVSKKLFFHNSCKNNTKLFICISKRLAEWYIDHGVPKNKIIVLHDAVNPNSFSTSKDISFYKHELGIEKNKLHFTYVGSLYKDRKIDIVIKAAQKLPQYNFTIIGGDDDDIINLKGLLNKWEVDNLKIMGYMNRDLLKRYLWASDYLLMLWSSKVKTIDYCSPLKTFEYMATKRVIIGHDFPTIREVLSHNIDAILIKPDSEQYLIDRIIKLSKSKYPQHLADSAYEKVRHKYTWEKRAQHIYDSIVKVI